MHHGKHSPAQCKIPCHSHFAYTQNKMTCKATNTTNMHDIATGKSWHCHISANMQQSCQAHLFPSLNIQQFQNTFNPLFKVLFIFPSRYLFAIGLVYICSCRWNIPPALRSNPKERDSMKSTVHNNMHMTHRTFTFLEILVQEVFMHTVVSHSSPQKIQGWWPKFPWWACSCAFAITCKILFGFWSSTYLYA